MNLKIINDILNDVKCTTVNGLLPRFMTSYTIYVRYHMFPLVRICISIFGDAWPVFVDMILVPYDSFYDSSGMTQRSKDFERVEIFQTLHSLTF